MMDSCLKLSCVHLVGECGGREILSFRPNMPGFHKCGEYHYIGIVVNHSGFELKIQIKVDDNDNQNGIKILSKSCIGTRLETGEEISFLFSPMFDRIVEHDRMTSNGR